MGFLKKVLKVVAVVAAVALAIPTAGGSLLAAGAAGIGITLSTVGAAALVAGLTIASGLLNQPKSPQVSNAAIDRLNLSIDPRTPRKIIFGETAMASDLRDYEYTGTDDEYVHYFIVNASHKIDGHTRIYLDDKLAWTAAGGVQGEFVGYLTVATRNEGSAANAIDISARMGNTRRYTGCAYIHLRFKRTGNSKKAESPFAQSIPQRFTTIGRGMPVYDPRQDSTVPGGSGAHRATDQATWTYGDHARNPALQLLTYLLGWRINGKLAVGKGIPVARLHLESFMAAANACDEPVLLAAGGTEPRYRSDGIFSEADDMTLVLDAFKTTMNAEIDDSDGRFAVRLMLDDLADPIAHFDMDDFLSGLTWSPISDISNRFNVVRGQFTDARAPSLYQLVDYPEVSIASVDGIERSHNFTLPLVQSPSQAQRLAKQVLQRQQYSGTLEVQVGHTGWRVQKYDIVTISHPPLGFNSKLFRVAAMTVGTHGQVQLTLREENEAIYAWDSDERPPVEPAGVTTYIYGNNPLLQGIEDSAQISIEVVAYRSFAANSSGAVISGLLPSYIVPSVASDGADIRTEDFVSYSIVTNGVTATVDNTLGDVNKGRIEITAVDSLNGSIDLTVTVNGISYPAKRIVIYKSVGLPVGFGGPGSKVANDNAFTSINGLTLVPISDTLTVTTAAGESLHGTASLDYFLNSDSGTGGAGFVARSVSAKWQYSPLGLGTWTDFGPEITGSPSIRTLRNGEVSAGHGDFNQSIEPPPGDYDVRLIARLDDVGETVVFEGLAILEAKV